MIKMQCTRFLGDKITTCYVKCKNFFLLDAYNIFVLVIFNKMYFCK